MTTARPLVLALTLALVASVLGACGESSDSAPTEPSAAVQETKQAPAEVEETSIALSTGCAIATMPGIVLSRWLLAKASAPGEPYVDDFVDNVSEKAAKIRQECPSQVVDLADDLEAAALGYQRGDVSEAEVDDAVKAYWIALGPEEGEDPEAAYQEAVEVLG